MVGLKVYMHEKTKAYNNHLSTKSDEDKIKYKENIFKIKLNRGKNLL